MLVRWTHAVGAVRASGGTTGAKPGSPNAQNGRDLNRTENRAFDLKRRKAPESAGKRRKTPENAGKRRRTPENAGERRASAITI